MTSTAPASILRRVASTRIPTRWRIFETLDLIKFCQTHKLRMITVDALAKYRFEMEYEESLSSILDFMPVTLRPFVPELDPFPVTKHVAAEYA